MTRSRWSRAGAYVAAAIFTVAAALGMSTSAQATTHSTASHATVQHTVTPKSAQSDGLGCPSTYACFWVDNYASGTMGKVSGNNTNYMNVTNSSGCTKYPGTWNDCISSLDNNGTSCTVYFWTNASYGGRYHSLAIGDAVYDFGIDYNDSSFNDSISSNHWCTAS
jgi:hypothetical protein